MTIAERIMAYAEAHYEDGGWDVIVECWSLKDIEDTYSEFGASTFETALLAVANIVEVFADRQADARNSAF